MDTDHRNPLAKARDEKRGAEEDLQEAAQARLKELAQSDMPKRDMSIDGYVTRDLDFYERFEKWAMANADERQRLIEESKRLCVEVSDARAAIQSLMRVGTKLGKRAEQAESKLAEFTRLRDEALGDEPDRDFDRDFQSHLVKCREWGRQQAQQSALRGARIRELEARVAELERGR